MLICCNRGQFFVIFLSPRAKLLTPDWSSGENTRSWLAEHDSFTFAFCVQINKFFEVLSKFDSLSRVLCTKNTWKSSAAAGKEILKGWFWCPSQETAKDYLCQKLKTWIGLVLFCLVEKLKSAMASKCFQRTITEHESVLLMGGRSRKKLLRKFLLWIHRLLFLSIYVRVMSKR